MGNQEMDLPKKKGMEVTRQDMRACRVYGYIIKDRKG